MKLVVDASIAVKWVSAELDHAVAVRRVAAHDLVAPELILTESANALWKKVRIKQMNRDQAVAGISFIRDSVKRLVAVTGLIDRAFELSFELDHPVYDCVYLACAESEGALLLTADRALANKAASKNVASEFLGAVS